MSGIKVSRCCQTDYGRSSSVHDIKPNEHGESLGDLFWDFDTPIGSLHFCVNLLENITHYSEPFFVICYILIGCLKQKL